MQFRPLLPENSKDFQCSSLVLFRDSLRFYVQYMYLSYNTSVAEFVHHTVKLILEKYDIRVQYIPYHPYPPPPARVRWRSDGNRLKTEKHIYTEMLGNIIKTHQDPRFSFKLD
jgi:hypothetical protein